MTRNQNSQRGGALVEFAMIAPFMAMIFFALLQFGYVMYFEHTVDYAARIGSRWAAVRGNLCANTSVCPTTSAAVQTYVRSVVPGLASPATVGVQWVAPPSTWKNQPSTCGTGSDENPGCIVEVTVRKPIKFVVPFVTSKTLTLQSVSQAVVQL